MPLLRYLLRLVGLASDPASAAEGEVFYHTGRKRPRFRIGAGAEGVWRDLGNVVVSGTNPGFTAPGLWIQTGLGASGADMTFWVEDGAE